MRKIGVVALATFILASTGGVIADTQPAPPAVATDLHASHEHGQTPVATTVSYNTKTGKYHNSGCRYWGCSNCITISRDEAIRRGGVACKVCGG